MDKRAVQTPSIKTVALRTVVCALMGVVLSVVLMLPVALLVSMEVLGNEGIWGAALAVMFITGFVSAAVSTGREEGKILLRSIITSAVMYIILLVVGFIVLRGSDVVRGIAPGLLALAGGAFAAVVKSMPKKRRRT